jgi:hypothetical protein
MSWEVHSYEQVQPPSRVELDHHLVLWSHSHNSQFSKFIESAFSFNFCYLDSSLIQHREHPIVEIDLHFTFK